MAANKQSALQKISSSFDALAPRERKIIFIATPLLILFVGYILAVEPLLIKLDTIDKRYSSIESQRAALESTKAELYQQLNIDPDEKTKLNIAQFEKRLAALEQQFQNELGQLVSPSAMPIVLESLFAKAGNLKLLKMESIAPKALFSEESPSKQLYQHGIRISFEGAYQDTRDFLESAENIGWKLYWKHLEYEVTEHPLAQTQLEVFTLSTSEAFIGVK